MVNHKSYRKKRYNRKKRYGGGMASKALGIARYVKSVMNVEYKDILTSIYTAVQLDVLSSSGFIPLTLLATGTTDQTRNGNSVLLKNLSIKGQLQLTASTVPVASSTRIVVLIDKNPAGVTPALADVFSSTSFDARYNPNNMGSRFKILWDKKYNNGFICTTTPLTAPPLTHQISYFKKLHMHAKYDDTSAVIASTTTGHIFAIAFNNIGPSSNVFVSATMSSRVSFIDN